MTIVASKELKNRLGKYLALVRQGKAVEITDRGRLIGCIVPARGPESASRAELLARLVAEGALRLGRGRLARHKPAVLRKGKTIVEMVGEGRALVLYLETSALAKKAAETEGLAVVP